MKKLAIPVLALGLALGACSETEAPEGDGTETVVEPTATETTVVTEEVPVEVPATTEEGSSVRIDGSDVDATISEDGVQADIKVD